MQLIGIILLKSGAALLILYLLFVVLHNCSGEEQINAVLRMETYFRERVYPRSELAPRWQAITPQNPFMRKKAATENKANDQQGEGRQDTWEQVEEELNSPYYLRTGQRLRSAAADGPLVCWYGEEAWIREILADRIYWKVLCRPISMSLIKPDSTEKEEAGTAARTVAKKPVYTENEKPI